jgi:hypothetical protein
MFRTATVLIASGVADNLPDVPGFSEELIVRDKVRLCPVCEGFEFIDRTIAVWGEAERWVKEALFLRAHSKSIAVLVASGSVGASNRARLAEAGIEVVENPLARLEELERAIAAIDADGRARRYDCIYLAMGSRPRTGLAVRLGAAVNKAGCLLVDAHQQTASRGRARRDRRHRHPQQDRRATGRSFVGRGADIRRARHSSSKVLPSVSATTACSPRALARSPRVEARAVWCSIWASGYVFPIPPASN